MILNRSLCAFDVREERSKQERKKNARRPRLKPFLSRCSPTIASKMIFFDVKIHYSVNLFISFPRSVSIRCNVYHFELAGPYYKHCWRGTVLRSSSAVVFVAPDLLITLDECESTVTNAVHRSSNFLQPINSNASI